MDYFRKVSSPNAIRRIMFLHTCHMPRPSHCHLFIHLLTTIIFVRDAHNASSLHTASCTFLFAMTVLCPTTFSITLLSNTLCVSSPSFTRDQDSHPCKLTRKIIFRYTLHSYSLRRHTGTQDMPDHPPSTIRRALKFNMLLISSWTQF